MAGPGRDQRAPMERLTVVLYVLSQADGDCPVERLTGLGLYHGTDESQREQLARDIGHLCALGWDIENVAAKGTPSRYRLVAGDNRLRLEFTAEERVELYRCARMANLRAVEDGLRPDSAWPEAEEEFEVDLPPAMPGLLEVLTAVSGRRGLEFGYFGRRRSVVPRVAYDRSGTWYVVARETGTGAQKTFRVDRMSDVHVIGPAGVAAPSSSGARRPRLDPLSWEWDDPVEVTVETTAEHRPRVVALLGSPVAEEPSGEAVRLRFRTTNRVVFLHRVCQLRERVRLLGPEDIRDQLRGMLLAVAGEG